MLRNRLHLLAIVLVCCREEGSLNLKPRLLLHRHRIVVIYRLLLLLHVASCLHLLILVIVLLRIIPLVCMWISTLSILLLIHLLHIHLLPVLIIKTWFVHSWLLCDCICCFLGNQFLNSWRDFLRNFQLNWLGILIRFEGFFGCDFYVLYLLILLKLLLEELVF